MVFTPMVGVEKEDVEDVGRSTVRVREEGYTSRQ